MYTWTSSLTSSYVYLNQQFDLQLCIPWPAVWPAAMYTRISSLGGSYVYLNQQLCIPEPAVWPAAMYTLTSSYVYLNQQSDQQLCIPETFSACGRAVWPACPLCGPAHVVWNPVPRRNRVEVASTLTGQIQKYGRHKYLKKPPVTPLFSVLNM